MLQKFLSLYTTKDRNFEEKVLFNPNTVEISWLSDPQKSINALKVIISANFQDYRNDEECFKIDNDVFLSTYGNAPILICSDPNDTNYKFSLEFSTKIPDYKLPQDMEEFYDHFPNGLVLNKLTNKDDKVEFLPLNKFSTIDLWMFSRCEIFEDYSETNPAIINLNDWVEFLTDANSVDNGAGRCFINLNPDAYEYGWILSYSSNDDGTLNIVAKSFTEMIEFLIIYPLDLSNCPEDDGYPICSSVADHMNRYCNCKNFRNTDETDDKSDEADDKYEKNRNDYFESFESRNIFGNHKKQDYIETSDLFKNLLYFFSDRYLITEILSTHSKLKYHEIFSIC